ncbi:MAG: hypothetical protein WD051_10920 [Steroidobacteraceae bacterium]
MVACRALVVGALVTSTAWAETPLPTPTSATLAGSTYVTLISVDPPPLRFHVTAAGVAIEAFELAPGPHRVRVEYEESGKQKVEGFESRETYTPSLQGSRKRSGCALEFDFEAGKLYRVVRSGITEDGKLRQFTTNDWGIWLVGEERNRPLAQCL